MKKIILLVVILVSCSDDKLIEVQNQAQTVIGTYRGGLYSTVYDPAVDGSIDNEIQLTITQIDGDSVKISNVQNWNPVCEEDPHCSYKNWQYLGGTINGKKLELWFAANRANHYRFELTATGDLMTGPVIYSSGDIVYTWMDNCILVKQP